MYDLPMFFFFLNSLDFAWNSLNKKAKGISKNDSWTFELRFGDVEQKCAHKFNYAVSEITDDTQKNQR